MFNYLVVFPFLAVMIIGLVVSGVLYFINNSDFRDNLGNTLGIAIVISLYFVVPMIMNILEIIFAERIKIYNQVCDAVWRKDLLGLGFVENTKEIWNNRGFTFKGLYKDIPFIIGSQHFDHLYVEIEIPLTLNNKGDENFDKFCEELSYRYKDLRLLLTAEKISIKIPTNEEIKSETMWFSMDELIEILNKEDYYELKLINSINNALII